MLLHPGLSNARFATPVDSHVTGKLLPESKFIDSIGPDDIEKLPFDLSTEMPQANPMAKAAMCDRSIFVFVRTRI